MTERSDFSSLEGRTKAWVEQIIAVEGEVTSLDANQQSNWDAQRLIEVASFCDDPGHWKALSISSMRGDKQAFKSLFHEFDICLELFFARLFTGLDINHACEQTLKSLAKKLHTLDPQSSILSWLLSIASYRAKDLRLENYSR